MHGICSLNYPQHDAMHEALTRASMNRLDSLPLYQAQPCSDYVYFVLDAVCSDGDPHNSMLNSTLLSFLKTLASRYANVWSYPTAASNSSDKWLLNRTRIYLYASGLVGETTVAIRSVVLTLFGSLLQSVPESDIGKDMMIDGGDVGLGLNLVDMASILVHLYVQHSGVETYDHQIRLLILNVLGSIRAQHWKCLSLPGPAGDTALQSVLKIDWNQCKNVSTGTGRGHLGCPTVAAVLFSILLHCGTLDVVGTVRAGAHKILGELLLILPLRESSLLCQQVVDSARIRPMLTSNTPIGQSVVAKITGAKDSLMWLETMGDCMDRVTEEYMHRVELDEKSVHILTECLCHIVRVILSGCCDNKVLVRMNSYWSLGNCLQVCVAWQLIQVCLKFCKYV